MVTLDIHITTQGYDIVNYCRYRAKIHFCIRRILLLQRKLVERLLKVSEGVYGGWRKCQRFSTELLAEANFSGGSKAVTDVSGGNSRISGLSNFVAVQLPVGVSAKTYSLNFVVPVC